MALLGSDERSFGLPLRRAKQTQRECCSDRCFDPEQTSGDPFAYRESGCIPAVLTRMAFEASSPFICASNCSGVVGIGVTLTAASLSRTLAVSSAFNISPCNLLMTVLGVRLGANRPTQKR